MKAKLDLTVISYDVFNNLIGHLYPNGKVSPGYNISNPLLPAKQKTPSFNVFKSKDGSYLYKDFATDDIGTCISFVQKLKGITLKEAIKHIER